MATKTILTDPDGVETTYTHARSAVERDLDGMPTSRIFIPRKEANADVPAPADDDLFIRVDGTDEYGGHLKDVNRESLSSQGKTELIAETFERYAVDGEPTSHRKAYDDAADSDIVKDALGRVASVDEGTIDTLDSSVSVLFHSASPARQIRLMRLITTGELKYKADGTLDYVNQLGTDRSGTTLSPTNQNVSTLRKLRLTGNTNRTHLRLFGAGGLSVDRVASSFSPGDAQQWGRVHLPSIGDQGTLETIGDNLLAELGSAWLEVEAELVDLDPAPALGDTYTVDYPDEDIDTEALRIANLKTIRKEGGVRWIAHLSNRTFAREHVVEDFGGRAGATAETGQPADMRHVPGTGQVVNLPSGKSLDRLVRVPTGKTLYLWVAGTETDASAASTDNPSICAELVRDPGGDDDVIYKQCVSSYERGDPLASLAAASAGVTAALRLNNTTTNDVPVSGTFRITIEDT